MNEEIKPIIDEIKEILNKYPDRQLEILLYVFGRDNIVKMSNELTYEQLQTENQQLKSTLEEIREYINELPFNDLVPLEVKVIKKLIDKGVNNEETNR